MQRKVRKVILQIESSRASGRALLRGIASYSRHHGQWAIHWEPGGLEKIRPRLKTFDAEGIIMRDVDQVDEVLKLGLPTIVFGHSQREIPGLANILTDCEAVGRMAAEHLLGCGFQHFAYCGILGHPWSDLRGESFSHRVGAAGFVPRTFPFEQKGTIPGSLGQAALVRWLQDLPKPVGLMACNDDRGRQVIEACKLAGLRVPEDVAIIGVDNDELVCELSDPPMSSTGINFERAGYEAAQLLDRLMRGERPRAARIVAHSTHVVPRQSTDIMAVQDSNVVRALRFIRDHSRRVIQVRDVVEASGLSRRVLEKRFRLILGRSVLKEIRRIRADQIAQMLVETNQPVSQIALAFGFSGVEHVARYFCSEKKLSPLAYRQRFGRK